MEYAAAAQAALGPVAGLRPPQSLNVTDTNISENWRLFRQKWQNYAVITNLNQQHGGGSNSIKKLAEGSKGLYFCLPNKGFDVTAINGKLFYQEYIFVIKNIYSMDSYSVYLCYHKQLVTAAVKYHTDQSRCLRMRFTCQREIPSIQNTAVVLQICRRLQCVNCVNLRRCQLTLMVNLTSNVLIDSITYSY